MKKKIVQIYKSCRLENKLNLKTTILLKYHTIFPESNSIYSV